jgi:homopolymeric O-antigen transport system permease protein
MASNDVVIIDSKARFAPFAIFELARYSELIGALTQREVKARYRQTLLGFSWAIAQPLAFMIVFNLVFSRFAKVPSDGVPYPVFSYAALVPWTFLTNALNSATISLVSQRSIVTKTYFPREVIVISQITARFIDFLAAAVVFAGLMVWYQIAPTAWLLFVPVLLVIQMILMLAVSLITAALHVSYRDLAPVVTLGLQVWLYLTPVSYPISIVPTELRPWYILNPMAGLIESYRDVIVHGRAPQMDALAASVIISLVLFAIAYPYFKRAERAFADVI